MPFPTIFSHSFIREYLGYFGWGNSEHEFVNYPDDERINPNVSNSDDDIETQIKSTTVVCINCGKIDYFGDHISLPEWRWKCTSQYG